MTVPMNRATPAQVAAFYDRRDPDQKRKKAPPKRLVRPITLSRPDGWELQLPIFVESKQANGMWWQSNKRAAEHKYDVITALCSMRALTLERERIKSVQLRRLSPQRLDPDNLDGAFKAVLDGIAVWFVEGDQALLRLHTTKRGKKRCDGKDVGHFDGKVFKKGRVRCQHDQVSNDGDRSLHGIRIRFRLMPKSSTGCST